MRLREGSIRLEGEDLVPSHAHSGCPFHTRCPRATDFCPQADPPLTPRPDGALVACHYA